MHFSTNQFPNVPAFEAVSSISHNSLDIVSSLCSLFVTGLLLLIRRFLCCTASPISWLSMDQFWVSEGISMLPRLSYPSDLISHDFFYFSTPSQPVVKAHHSRSTKSVKKLVTRVLNNVSEDIVWKTALRAMTEPLVTGERVISWEL